MQSIWKMMCTSNGENAAGACVDAMNAINPKNGDGILTTSQNSPAAVAAPAFTLEKTTAEIKPVRRRGSDGGTHGALGAPGALDFLARQLRVGLEVLAAAGTAKGDGGGSRRRGHLSPGMSIAPESESQGDEQDRAQRDDRPGYGVARFAGSRPQLRSAGRNPIAPRASFFR